MTDLTVKKNWRGQLILQVKVPAHRCLTCSSGDASAKCWCSPEHYRDAKLTDFPLKMLEPQP